MTGSVKCYEYEKHKKVSQHTLKKENAPEAIHFQGVYSYFLLSHQDSNLDKQNQKLLCYHYTMGQTNCAFC